MKLVKESLNEELRFERTGDVKKSLGLGKREKIHRWFREWAPYAEYEIEDDLSVHVRDSLLLGDSQVTRLPEDLSVGGDLQLGGSQVSQLPEGLSVGKNLRLGGSQVTKLPEDLSVGRNIYIHENQDIEVPEKLEHKIKRY